MKKIFLQELTNLTCSFFCWAAPSGRFASALQGLRRFASLSYLESHREDLWASLWGLFACVSLPLSGVFEVSASLRSVTYRQTLKYQNQRQRRFAALRNIQTKTENHKTLNPNSGLGRYDLGYALAGPIPQRAHQSPPSGRPALWRVLRYNERLSDSAHI